MSLFRDVPIRKKVNRLILLVSALTLTLVGACFAAYAVFAYRDAVLHEAKGLAKVIGINSSAPLMFKDEKSGEEILASLREDRRFLMAVLYDDSGKIFVRYQSEKAEQIIAQRRSVPEGGDKIPSAPLAEGHYFRERWLDLYQPVEYRGERLGTLFLRFDTAEMYEQLLVSLGITLGILLAGILLAFGLASRLQTQITAPIGQLADVARRVSESKDYSLRAASGGRDEIGFLVERFNEMLGQIQLRGRELERAHDILEERVRARTHELQDARAEAENANRLKTQFLANMSHEIRTPMNAVLGYVQLLQMDDNLTEEQKSHINTIYRSGLHLIGLIDDILDVSKIETGHMQISENHFDLNLMIEDTAALFQFRCQEKGLSWSVSKPSENVLHVCGDEKRLRQVLVNLLGNAVKFTDSGPVSLTVAREEGDRFCFEIADTGEGIEESEQTDLFKLFRQGAMGFKKGGTGLGLAISAKLVGFMGGELRVRSKKNEGTAFHFTIPLKPSVFDIASPEEGQKDAGSAAKKVLVVDDLEENREILRKFLHKMGADVEEAADGEEALEKVRQCNPEIIFMDIRMPRMNGVEAIEEINRQYGRDRFNIIVVSASVLHHEREQYRLLGCREIIEKPFTYDKVLATLDNFRKH